VEAQGPQGTPPGWYSNPQGPGQRYWDGTKWTDSYSQGQQQLPQQQFPQQPPQKSGGMPGWVKVLLGLLAAGAVVIVVGIVGCAALVGGTANEIDKGIKKEQNSNAITNEQARAVKLGTTRGAVESKFGPPKSDQESTNEGLGDDTCIYYNVKGGEILDQWQFCFGGAGKGGKLTTKNRL